MKLLADLHTHSKNSRFGHGKNSIEEMAIAANEIGLVEIGITDHGYSHFFKTSKQKLKQARKIVDEINSWSKTKVLLGIEADIIKEDGTIDIDNETLSMLDILIVGYHRLIFTDFAGLFGNTKKTEQAKRKCTNAFINAIRKYPVTIVSHLDSVLTTDLYEIGKVCRERGTMVEINNRHTKWNDKQMAQLIDSGCMFVISSDAHSRNDVGEVDRAMEYITKYNIPSERVVNVQFSEEEKSEQDREYSAYRSVYEQVAKAKRIKEEALETKLKTEITGNLSDEMEKALRDIAKEKGLHYEERKTDREFDSYIKSDDDEEMDELILKAKEYIRQKELENIAQENEQINAQEEEEEEYYSFDMNHSLLKDEFADKFQAINSVIKQSEGGDSKVSEIKIEDNLASKNIKSEVPAYKQLEETNYNQAKMQNLKNIMSESSNKDSFENRSQSSEKSEIKIGPRKVAPENFMESITQTRLAGGTNVKTEETPKPAKRTSPSSKGRGAFIVVDNLLGDDKK